jgi:hypothetical protein
MNMPFIFSAFSCLVISCFVSAQEPQFTWSRAETKPTVNLEVRVLGTDANGYFVSARTARKAGEFNPTVIIEYFTNQHQRVFSKNIPLPSNVDYVDVAYLKNRAIVFYAEYFKAESKNSLYALEIPASGTLAAPVEITTMPAEKLSSRGSFSVAASSDGSKLIVLGEPAREKEQNETLHLSLYNQDLKKQWSSSQHLPYERTKAIDNRPYLSNEGTLFMIKRTDMKGAGNSYTLFTFNGKDLKEFKLEMDGKKKISTITQTFAPNGDFLVGGYFNESGKVSVSFGTPLHGSFLLRVDNSGAAQKFYSVHAFSETRKNLLAKYVVADNENAVLMGEEAYTQDAPSQRRITTSNTTGPSYELDYTYYGRNILIEGFDAKGKPTFSKTVAKDNVSKNDNGTWVGFFAGLVNKKLLLIYHDDENKYDEKNKTVVFNPIKIPVLLEMDFLTGTTQRAIGLFNTSGVGGRKSDMLMRPDVFLKLKENEYIIRGENRETYKMGKVVF